ncbi:MAG: hypothetical protein IBX72_12785 [Nitrospirae bacterium]|nr:hypothetical protein [Nitrospirota bacterium]
MKAVEKSDNQLKITSTLREEFSTKINIEGETYLIESEDLGNQNAIITRVFHKGKIIHSHKIDYKDVIEKPDLDMKIRELINKEQHLAIDAFKKEKTTQKRLYKDYLEKIESLIRRNKYTEAVQLLDDALEHYPNNPIIISYKGYLEAVVYKTYSEGKKICTEAFKISKEQMPLVEVFFLSTLYLNLGRVFLLSNKKREAYDSFKKGLEFDSKNEHLLNELKKLGIRKKIPIPFLKRSNPLNKYLGKLLKC